MLILSQIKKLRELHQKYAYDLSVLSQKGIELDEENKLKTLALVDFHSKVLDLIHDYIETDESPEAMAAIVVLFESFVGTIAGILYHKDPELALVSMVKGMEMQASNYKKEGGK